MEPIENLIFPNHIARRKFWGKEHKILREFQFCLNYPFIEGPGIAVITDMMRNEKN